MKLFYTILLLFSCSYLNSTHQAATIVPPLVFEPFNPFTMPPIGLYNLGNSCYMNAMLQCLYRISPITKFLVDTQGLDTQDKLLLAYQKFVNSYTYSLASNKPIRPVNFHSVLRQMYNWGYGQQDSSEALNYMLGILPPELTNNYQLQLISNINCNAKHETHPNELLNVLTIPVTANHNLIDYLNHYFEEEKMAGDNIFHCDSCEQLIEATKQIKLANLPNYLIIKINLEEAKQAVLQDGSPAINKKGQPIIQIKKQLAHPQIPLNNVDMNDYLNAGAKVDDTNYELFGCTWHLGPSLRSGHYVATVKIEDKWYLCDDKDISEILQPEETLGNGYLDSTNRNDANPYVLFYRKIGLPQEDEIDHAKYPENQESESSIFKNISNKDNSSIAMGIAAALAMYFSQTVSDWWNKTENVNILRDLTNLVATVLDNKDFKPEILSNSDFDLDKLEDKPYLLIKIEEEFKNQKDIYDKLKSKYELIGYVAQEKSGWIFKKPKPIAHIKINANTWGKFDISDSSNEYTEENNLSLQFGKRNFDFSNIQAFCFKLKTESSNLVNVTTSLSALI